jgi:hypothetical protein
VSRRRAILQNNDKLHVQKMLGNCRVVSNHSLIDADRSLAQPRSKHSIGSSLGDVARVTRSSLLDELQRASRDPHAAAEKEHTAQQSQGASLVGGGQGCWDEVPERGDAHDDLQGDKVDDAEHSLLRIFGQHGAHARREAAVAPERDDGGEGCGGEDAVVELHEDGVLEHVAPPQVGLVWDVAVEGIEHLALGREDALAHPGEVVVDHSSVEAGDKGAGHGGGEDEGAEGSCEEAEGSECRRLEGFESFQALFWVGEKTVLAQDCKTVPEHKGVSDEGCTQVGRETILRDARLVASLEKLVLEARLDHPPADNTLHSNETADTTETPGHGLANLPSRDEVDGRQQGSETDDSAPQTVSPFHPVDLLEVVQVHVRVQHLELGAELVASVFIFPMLLVHGRQRAGDGAPFCDAEAGLGETSETAKDDDSKDAGCGAE